MRLNETKPCGSMEITSKYGDKMTTQTIEEDVRDLKQLALKNDNTLTSFVLKTNKQLEELNKRMDRMEGDIREIKALLSSK